MPQPIGPTSCINLQKPLIPQAWYLYKGFLGLIKTQIPVLNIQYYVLTEND